MAHRLVLGMTESGKTTWAKILCNGLVKKGVKCAVLDPMMIKGAKSGWGTNELFTDSRLFLQHCKKNTKRVLFIDEGSETVGRWDEDMQWFATRSRHWGHSCNFISQRVQQMSRTIREQASEAVLFALAQSDMDLFAKEWNQPELFNNGRLKQFEFFIVSRFNPLKKGIVDVHKQTISFDNFTGNAALSNRLQELPAGSDNPSGTGSKV